MNHERVAELVKELLTELGEDTEREGLQKTPQRVAAAMEYLTRGYRQDINEIVNDALFEAECNNMIISRDIEVYSMCEHHMLPFYGRCHIGYIPRSRVLGLSKLARIVDFYARRFQIQERLTSQIASEIEHLTNALGVGVVIECRHLCSMMRGVKKQDSIMTTSSVLGTFHDDAATRQEFLSLIARNA